MSAAEGENLALIPKYERPDVSARPLTHLCLCGDYFTSPIDQNRVSPEESATPSLSVTT